MRVEDEEEVLSFRLDSRILLNEFSIKFQFPHSFPYGRLENDYVIIKFTHSSAFNLF